MGLYLTRLKDNIYRKISHFCCLMAGIVKKTSGASRSLKIEQNLMSVDMAEITEILFGSQEFNEIISGKFGNLMLNLVGKAACSSVLSSATGKCYFGSLYWYTCLKGMIIQLYEIIKHSLMISFGKHNEKKQLLLS